MQRIKVSVDLLLQGRAGGGGLAEAGSAVGEAGLLDAAVGVEALAGALELDRKSVV